MGVDRQAGGGGSWRQTMPIEQTSFCDPQGDVATLFAANVEWEWNWLAIHLFRTADSANVQTHYASVPYWAIACPLTLLSAWLLLPKPRKSTPKKIAELIPVGGT